MEYGVNGHTKIVVWHVVVERKEELEHVLHQNTMVMTALVQTMK